MSGEALKSLSIKNLRGCIEPFTLVFEEGKKLTIVHGENGSGKSTICDAFEFISRGEIGSLDDRGLGQTQRYWPTLGKKKEDIVVRLETHGDTYSASQDGNATVWTPTGCKPTLEILRRSQILKLIEAEPAKRYNEISRFINVSGVGASEDSLEKLIKTVRREWDDQIKRLQGSEDSLKSMFQAAGGKDGDPVTWARQEAARDYSRYEKESKALAGVEGAFQRLSSHVGTWAAAQERLKEAQNRVKASQDALGASLAGVSEDAGDIIEILSSAKTFLSKVPEPASCPLCESREKVAGLGDRVTVRIEAFRSLKTAKDNLAAAKKAAEVAAPEPDRLKEKYAKERNAFQMSLKGEWSEEVPLPTTDCPDDMSEFDAWYEANKELVDKWRALSSKRSEEKNTSAKIKEVLKAYDDNRELPADVEALIPRLEKALGLTREERHAYTDGILSKIADEVGRLYEVVHPGEGLQKISLQLDAKKRASLDLGAEFCGTAGVPPQAYFSESHLDTLGLCVFLALAKMDAPSDTVLVIDDVLASVDEPHVDRVVQMLYDQVSNFRHCIFTTHYGPWKEKFRWGFLREKNSHIVELGTWSLQKGIQRVWSVPKLERLKALLDEPAPDANICAGQAGILLEALLLYLAKLYQCKIAYKPGQGHTISELISGMNKELKKALRVEVLEKDASGKPQHVSHELAPVIEEISKIAGARNLLGAHFNLAAFNHSDQDAIQFANAVFKLAGLLIDENGQWPRTDKSKSGSYWATSDDSRRLYPLKQPD